MINRAFLFIILLAAGLAQAQQYRWVDEKGRPHYSDTPPANAKAAKKTEAKTASPAGDGQQVNFELQRAQKDFPVTLYTAPDCKGPCELARAALNKRGVPFTEVPVSSADALAQLKSTEKLENVPVLVVGRSILGAFEATSYDSLLDSAGYPKQGVLPARSQPAPEGYEPTPEPLRSEPAASAKPGPYDTSGLKSNRSGKPGPYLAPGSAK